MTNALKESVKRGFDSSVSGLSFEEKKLVELCFLYNNRVEELVSKFVDKSGKAKVEGYSISERKFNSWTKKGMFYDRTAGHITYWVFLLAKFLTHKQTREQVSGDRWKKLLEAEDILRKAASQTL